MKDWQVIEADCVEAMAAMPEASVDAVVCDPPAGISFMARDWDHHRGGLDGWVAWMTDVMAEALRVCKPGAHAFVWALPRTSHWTGMALERAGWQVRDVVTHLFGSGFPKSHNLPNGWGTALKPSAEFWFLARKPLAGTVAGNVLAHGTGALNVDGCRIGYDPNDTRLEWLDKYAGREYGEPRNRIYGERDSQTGGTSAGRWPANVVLDPEAAAMLDEQSEARGMHSAGSAKPPGGFNTAPDEGAFLGGIGRGMEHGGARHGDSGGASRFFYVAKASSSERSAGLPEGMRSSHPTVKPIDLMRWLVRLVGGQPGSTILDPFCGSGTTGIACSLEGFRFVGIEQDATYVQIARARIAWWAEHPEGMELVQRLEAERERKRVEDAGQLGLFGEAA